MISTGDLKRGQRIEIDGEPYGVLSVHVQTPSARGAATLVKVKLRSLITGQFRDRTFKGGEKIAEANVQLRRVQFLYADGDSYHRMDTASYDQVALSSEALGEAARYRIEGVGDLRPAIFTDRVVSVELQHTSKLRVL